MPLRSFWFSSVLLLVSLVPCLAEQPTEPVALDGAAVGETAVAPDAVNENPVDAGPIAPAGTVSRPQSGEQHPDLDKAWADYEAAVANATEAVKAAIASQFDAATAKGDLDTADKWQVIGERFEKAGELPAEGQEVKAAVADYKRAKDELAKAYESVVKGLTIAKKIPEAKAVRAEWAALAGDAPKQPIVAQVPPTPEARKRWLMGIWIMNVDVEARAEANGNWTEINTNNKQVHAVGKWGGPDAEGFFKIRLNNGWTVFIRPTAQGQADVKFISPEGKETGQRVIRKKGAR